MPFRNDEEIGDRNPMVREKFLGERLAARENKPARITSGIRNTQQLEQAHNVLIEEHVAVELFEHVEHNVRLELLDGIANGEKFVLHAECADFMPELPEALY